MSGNLGVKVQNSHLPIESTHKFIFIKLTDILNIIVGFNR